MTLPPPPNYRVSQDDWLFTYYNFCVPTWRMTNLNSPRIIEQLGYGQIYNSR